MFWLVFLSICKHTSGQNSHQSLGLGFILTNNDVRERKFSANLQSGAINISGKLHFHSMRHCQDLVGVDLHTQSKCCGRVIKGAPSQTAVYTKLPRAIIYEFSTKELKAYLIFCGRVQKEKETKQNGN